MAATDAFLITGGGTGAKVAEAVVHLCAAGLGPARLHILLVDSDTANGNLKRAKDTILAYQRMQRWPWSVRASVRQGLLRRDRVWLDLFRTEIHVYEVTDQIATVREGGLETAGAGSPELRLVLDLLYDPEEQSATCEDGFRARPNLGCLLLAEHLAQKLPEKASGFLKALKSAASSGEDRVPVAVAASVFGGTGASLLPIARRTVEAALEADTPPDQLARLDWAAVKLLPHYRPTERRESVDPDRFLLDTSGALQFYSSVYDTTAAGSRYGAIFVVGSDNPARNRVKPVLGHSQQANPAYFEEVLAGLSVLRFVERRAEAGKPMLVYAAERVTWETLPHQHRETLRESLGFVLHLAAFYLRRGSGGPAEQRSVGLARLLRNGSPADLNLYPWYQRIVDAWAQFHPTYKAAGPGDRLRRLRDSASMQEHSIEAMLKPAGEYFGRLLLFAESALRGEDLSFLEHSESQDYADMYAAMSEIKADEVDTQRGEGAETRTLQPAEDNVVVRVLRTAASAMVKDHGEKSKRIGANRRFTLIDDGRIRIRTTQQQTEDVLRELDLTDAAQDYGRTRAD